MAKKLYKAPESIETAYESPVFLQERIDHYFSECEASGKFPDEAGMIRYLGVSRRTLDNYLTDEGSYKGFGTVIQDARTRRESILVRDIYNADSKTATGKIFLAKQISNGGLIDRPVQTGADEIRIRVNIGDGDAKLLE